MIFAIHDQTSPYIKSSPLHITLRTKSKKGTNISSFLFGSYLKQFSLTSFLEKLIKEKEEVEKDRRRQEKLAREKALEEEKARKAVEKKLAIWDLEYLEIYQIIIK